ncbi:Shikimate 5-dehydrogenase I alpha [hydrothermal vent metagenome]|uniref:shikimate dehydrogenase (NADP(+)) n=1 Tax=hydrothermal vent metagenome TaxID=652676 RepID=A0A3B1CEB4_9ZZZZ
MPDVKEISQSTKLVGVIGHPLKHSYSPFMHNLAFTLTDLDYLYLPFDITSNNLKDALKGMVALGITGFNVTIPHKEKVIPFLNEVSEAASIVGAVNTIVNDNGILYGHNTDVHGIYETLKEYKKDLSKSVVSIFGAGGAARSVVFTLLRYFHVKKIHLINRTVERADIIKTYFSEKMLYDRIKTHSLYPPDLIKVLSKSKLIINASSIGMYPKEDDSPTKIAESFNSNQLVFDIVYNPISTKFLRLAAREGATTINGLKMFVEQGARSFELWTGKPMPVEEVYAALKSQLKEEL